MKINKDGDTIWSKKWSANPDFPRNLTTIKQMSINKFILSCEVSYSLYGAPPGSFMLITDTLGNEICSGGGVDGTIHQTRISDNNFFVLGMNWYDYEIVINKNNNCSIVNHLYFDENNAQSDFEFDNQGNIYLTSSTYNSAIRKINSAGTILWTNNLIPDESVSPASIVIDDNKLIATGNVHPTNEIYQFFISICDTSASPIQFTLINHIMYRVVKKLSKSAMIFMLQAVLELMDLQLGIQSYSSANILLIP